jgi:hypothetical protein
VVSRLGAWLRAWQFALSHRAEHRALRAMGPFRDSDFVEVTEPAAGE